jgi:hypothetical protein
MLPYMQGHLNGLCGIYSIINATRLIIRNMREQEATRLFGKCMRHVEKRRSLGMVSTSGINEGDLWSILTKLVIVNYSISVERPFHKTGKMSVNNYIQELAEYFGEDGKRSAIILVESRDWGHWTVIRSMTMKRIILFDSYFLKTISIAKCVVRKPTEEKPYVFTPPLTFFLYEK